MVGAGNIGQSNLVSYYDSALVSLCLTGYVVLGLPKRYSNRHEPQDELLALDLLPINRSVGASAVRCIAKKSSQ